MNDDYEYLGNLSVVPPWHERKIRCDDCKVYWIGCLDNFECPKCGKGDIPKVNQEKINGPPF